MATSVETAVVKENVSYHFSEDADTNKETTVAIDAAKSTVKIAHLFEDANQA